MSDPVMVEFSSPTSSFSRLEADYRMTIRNLAKAFEMILEAPDEDIKNNIARTAISITKGILE